MTTWANWRILFPSRRHRIFFWRPPYSLAVVELEWPAGTLLPPSQIWCISVTTTTLAFAFGRGRVWKWQGQAGHDHGGSGRRRRALLTQTSDAFKCMRGKKERKRIRRFVLWAINACVGTVLHRALLLSTQ